MHRGAAVVDGGGEAGGEAGPASSPPGGGGVEPGGGGVEAGGGGTGEVLAISSLNTCKRCSMISYLCSMVSNRSLNFDSSCSSFVKTQSLFKFATLVCSLSLLFKFATLLSRWPPEKGYIPFATL